MLIPVLAGTLRFVINFIILVQGCEQGLILVSLVAMILVF
jgi:hypothetical protein